MQDRYRVPLCPYLAIGNQRVLIHLDAYCVPQSLEWPNPGSPDRLGWRDPFDEWPYWDEVTDDIIRTHMPFFEYPDGAREYLHEAENLDIDYITDTNILEGRYLLPGGAEVSITTFVLPDTDIWARRYRVTGTGRFVLQGEFFSKMVRGFPGAHLGNIDFRGAFIGAPRGMYVITSTLPITQQMGNVEFDIDGEQEWTLYMCIADDLRAAASLCSEISKANFDSVLSEAISADCTWISKAGVPTSTSPFVQENYRRWLLANRLCLSSEGAMLAGPRPFWSFVWPRDASLSAAGFASAGFAKEAQSIVKWLLDNTPDTRIHEARYFADRAPVLLDNRMRQGDNPGYIAWSTSFVCKQEWNDAFVESVKEQLFALADLLVSYRDPETLLPMPEADYWELQTAESLSIAVSSIGGLLGVAYVADRLGLSGRAERYRMRAQEIKIGACRHLWNDENKYFMQAVKPLNTDTDVAICLGVYPFGAWDADDPMFADAVRAVKGDRWSSEMGGMLCGQGTPTESFWFYHTLIFLLGVSVINDHTTESEILASLERNLCPQGLVPEQVSSRNGHLWGCSYLTTAQGCLLLYAYRDGS